jgi:hypothetical protein
MSGLLCNSHPAPTARPSALDHCKGGLIMTERREKERQPVQTGSCAPGFRSIGIPAVAAAASVGRPAHSSNQSDAKRSTINRAASRFAP